MATVKGVFRTLVDAGGPANLHGYEGPKLLDNPDNYVLAGTEASGTVLKMGKLLPAGAKVVGFIIYVSAAQTGLTISIGDGNSATRYLSAGTQLQAAGAYLIGGQQYVIGTATDDNDIKLTTGGATATAGTLRLDTLYVLS